MVKNIFEFTKGFIKDENGLTTAEWVILASAITVAAIGIVALLMPKIKNMATKVGAQIDNYDSTNPTAPTN